MGAVIVARDLSKRYRIGEVQHGGMLREALMNALKGAWRRPEREEQTTWALRDVSFDVEKSEIVGIVGRNGAGKSTLLKLLSRITYPTSGEVRVQGRVAPLVEVGTGFHQELTGRENIFLNGSILGLRRREIKERFDAIVEFSGLAKFLDTPLKRYSSGMRMRLGFAIAAHLSSEILLVDEVLAVGDAEFQKKCLQTLSDLGQSGRTVLFVSHNLEAIERLCPRTLWIDEGRVSQDGETRDVIASYLSSGAQTHTASVDLAERETRSGSGEIRLTSLDYLDAEGRPAELIRSGDALTMRLGYEVASEVRTPHFGVMFYSDLGTLVAHANTWSSNVEIPMLPVGAGRIDLRIDPLNLVPGRYPLTLWVERQGDNQSFDLLEHSVILTVRSPSHEGAARLLKRRAGLVYFPCAWDVGA